MMRQTATRKRQQGFTLIEIIAVLIVLAILAAVAVPRYMDTVAQSRNSSAQQAVAEGMSRLTAIAGRLILTNNGALPTNADVVGALDTTTTPDNDTTAGDYTIGYTAVGGSTTDITVTATGSGPAAGGTATGTWHVPTQG